MTVVACGAAIHASSIRRARSANAVQKTGPALVHIDLHYDPVSPDSVTTVSGRVTSPPGFRGEVRLGRAAGDWETGWTPLSEGAFVCELALQDHSSTEFEVSLRDMQGNLVEVEPSSFSRSKPEM